MHMNIVTAQLNYTIGDFKGNVTKIINAMSAHDKADIVVFSELCLSGYYPKDLIERDGFMLAQQEALDKVIEASKHIQAAVVIGAIMPTPSTSKKFFNSLLFIQRGKVLHQYNKQLLPTYGVFDEDRHFIEDGSQKAFLWGGTKIGFLVCEDGWFNDSGSIYHTDPVSDFANDNVDLVISINASPYDIGKYDTRFNLISEIATRCDAPVVYVNQVGGIDELVFDGGSMIACKDGLLFMAPAFEEDISMTNIYAEPIANGLHGTSDTMGLITKQLVTGLRDYCHKSGFSKVVVGSSGGIDSAVTLALAVLALGSENVVAVTMPSKYSSAGSVDDSVDLCNALNIKLVNAPIKDTFDAEVRAYTEAFGEAPSGLAQENLQARIRGQRLMTFSNTTGAMVLSTGNKSEVSVGYCTLYGDMAGGLSLIADLYKCQVYTLARYLNDKVFEKETIPNAIIDKAPSAELAPDQLDTDSLPPYPVLDAYLIMLLEGKRLPKAEYEAAADMVKNNMSQADQDRVRAMLDRNEYKRRQSAPIIRVSQKAFGYDRQIPLTANTKW